MFASDKYAPANTTGNGLFAGGGATLLINQLIGIGSVFAWSMVTGFILFGALKYTMGLRVTPEEEVGGLDIGEHGSEAYPDWSPTLHAPVPVDHYPPAAVKAASSAPVGREHAKV